MAKQMKDIIAAIATLSKDTAEIDQRWQGVAMDVLEHYAEHTDITLVNRLYMGMTKGQRKTAMAHWLFAYGSVVANDNVESRSTAPFMNNPDKAKRQPDIEAAKAKPWYDFKPDPAVHDMVDVGKAFRALLAKVAKATEMKGATLEQLAAAAVALGIPASDVPSKLADKKETTTA